jgi:hypothetical protein
MSSETQAILARIWNDVQRNLNSAEAERVRADPVGHKLTRLMEKPLSYRYWQQRGTRKGRKVRWCWSCHRNVAGYFLGWREVETATTVKRDQWVANRVKRKLEERAKRKAGR